MTHPEAAKVDDLFQLDPQTSSFRSDAKPFRAILGVMLHILLLSAVGRADAVWPQFRGPGGQGVAEVDQAPLQWSEDENVKWKIALPGRAWSSPVIANGTAWVTTAEEIEATPQERRARAAANKVPNSADHNYVKQVALSALEIEISSGRILHSIPLFEVDDPPSIHALNSFASPTPLLADGRLFCHFGTFGTACIDLSTGDVLWEQRFEIEHYVGPGSSPVLAGGLLVLTCDGADQQYVVAVKTSNGKVAWREMRPEIRETNPDMRKSYCTPLLIEFRGREELVIPGSQWFVAYDPATGDELWRIDHGSGFSLVPRPVFDGKRLYLCTGFGVPQLWAVRPGGSGDVTNSHVVWQHRTQVPAMASPLVVDGRIYFVSDKGILTCLAGSSGEMLWRERIGGDYSASPLHADGKIYFADRQGRVTVIDDGPEFKLLAENQLDGQIMASPVPYDGDLLLRTATHLYRVGE